MSLCVFIPVRILVCRRLLYYDQRLSTGLPACVLYLPVLDSKNLPKDERILRPGHNEASALAIVRANYLANKLEQKYPGVNKRLVLTRACSK